MSIIKAVLIITTKTARMCYSIFITIMRLSTVRTNSFYCIWHSYYITANIIFMMDIKIKSNTFI